MSLPGTRGEQVRKLYGGDEGVAEEFYGDAFFVAPARFLAACMQRAQQPAWLYHFSYVPEKILGNLSGAPHGLEVPFVFANKHPNLPLSEADMAAAERISGYWVRFTKTGDPNEAGHRIWPAYTAESDELLEFGNEAFSARTRFRKAKLDLVDELFRSGLRLPSAEGW
jgi:para-nitrobenzyl esterase